MARRTALMSMIAITAAMTATACSDSTRSSGGASPPTATSASASSPTPTGPAVSVGRLPTVTTSKVPSKTPGRAATTAPPKKAPARPSRASGGCPVLPADNVWHAKVTGLPVVRQSGASVAAAGADRGVHPDFGSGEYEGRPFGMPITTVPAGQAKVRVSFEYAGESDRGPYPIPVGAKIEGGPNADGDRHVILRDAAACRAYELFAAHRNSDGSWRAGSGAIFDLRSNALRPRGWTSADAAGLPILPGLVRYDEVAAGRIDHAIRITAPRTRNAFVWPARHAASSSSDASLPAMGQRFRLKADVAISRLPAQARVVAQALKTYGAILADNGSAWYLSGTQDSRWNNDALHALGQLSGGDFEAVNVSGLMARPDSAAVR
jgi:hypothetical protein